MKTILFLPDIMITFIGKTVATNLSTVITTRLIVETEYEINVKYLPNLHPSADKECPKTETRLPPYSAPLVATKSRSDTAILVM